MNIEFAAEHYMKENRIKPYWREGKVLISFSKWAAKNDTKPAPSAPPMMREVMKEPTPVNPLKKFKRDTYGK
jgi:hypothetical protein